MAVAVAAASNPTPVQISRELVELSVQHGDERIEIKRIQDIEHTVSPAWARTSRRCPPKCIQPMQLGQGIETLGTLEFIDFLERHDQGEPILIIDARTDEWTQQGTIPGSIPVPWTQITPEQAAPPKQIAEHLRLFGACRQADQWQFSQAKTLVVFCNGIWCDQSSNAILSLREFGYPAAKLKWYRGGMQTWHLLGLTTAAPLAADKSADQPTSCPAAEPSAAASAPATEP